jgi:nicotinate-nucleotide adenylyltransferase
MLELALKDYPHFELSRIEDPAHTSGEPNYSITTIRRFKRERNLTTDELYFIVGIDSFQQIETWREPQAVMTECRIIVASRPGYDEAMVNALLRSCHNDNISLLETVAVDVSSTQIRAAVASGDPLEKYVLPSVAAYIIQHHLYR